MVRRGCIVLYVCCIRSYAVLYVCCMHSHVFCMRVVLCACCIVIYIVCVNCIVASYLLYIVCMLCSSSKEERLCRLLRRLNYKSINQSLNGVIISADPPLHGLICVDKRIVFTCKVTNVAEGASLQYQWSIGDGKLTIGNNTFPMRVSSLSTITVTCEAYVHGVSTQYGKDTVTIKPTGKLIVS